MVHIESDTTYIMTLSARECRILEGALGYVINTGAILPEMKPEYTNLRRKMRKQT